MHRTGNTIRSGVPWWYYQKLQYSDCDTRYFANVVFLWLYAYTITISGHNSTQATICCPLFHLMHNWDAQTLYLLISFYGSSFMPYRRSVCNYVYRLCTSYYTLLWKCHLGEFFVAGSTGTCPWQSVSKMSRKWHVHFSVLYATG